MSIPTHLLTGVLLFSLLCHVALGNNTGPLTGTVEWTTGPFRLISDPLISLHDELVTTATSSQVASKCRHAMEKNPSLKATSRVSKFRDAVDRYCTRYAGAQGQLRANQVTLGIAKSRCQVKMVIAECPLLLDLVASYASTDWTSVDERNREWAKHFASIYASLGERATYHAELLLGFRPFPKDSIAVYLVNRGGRLDAYSIDIRSNFGILMSTSAEKTAGVGALEFAIHESLHSPLVEHAVRHRVGNVGRGCNPVRSPWWHATIFSVAGEAVQRASEDVHAIRYERYDQRSDVARRLLGGELSERYKEEWRAHLESSASPDAIYSRLREVSSEGCARSRR
jgi:hypothetical protein